MSATIDARLFHEVLGRASQHVPRNHSLPVLGTLRLHAQDGALTVSGTNLQSFYEERVSAEGTLDVLLDLKQLKDKLPKGKPAKGAVVEIDDSTPAPLETATQRLGQIIWIRSGVKAGWLRTLDPHEFPLPIWRATGFTRRVRLDFDTAAFLHAVESTLYAAATEDTRPILKVLRLHSDRHYSAVFVGADGYRLAQTTIRGGWTDANNQAHYNLDATGMGRLAKALAQAKDSRGEFISVEFWGRENQDAAFAVFESGAVRAQVQLVEGNYPDYHQIIPLRREHSYVAHVPLQTLNQALDGMKDTLRLGFTSTDGVNARLEITHRDDEGTETTSTVEGVEQGACSDGLSYQTAVKGIYLRQAIQTYLDGEHEWVTLFFGHASQPVLVTSRSLESDADGTISVIMPMHLGR